MPTDSPTPLASVANFTEGPFANLVSGYSAPAQSNLMLQATRACESACDRRLAPFTGIIETQRADAVDTEDAMDTFVPLDPASQLGFSRAASLGTTLLTRHFWLREFPARYPELWTASISAITLYRSYSGAQLVSVGQIQFEPDTGHVRFQLGTFVPQGTTIQVTYSGGYSTVPADLVQACQYMAASMAVKQLDPVDGHSGHDPDALRADALEMLAPYTRR